MTAAKLAVGAECTEDPIRRLKKKNLILPEVRREMHAGIRIPRPKERRRNPNKLMI